VAKRFGKHDEDTPQIEVLIAAFNAGQGALKGVPEQRVEFLSRTLLVDSETVKGITFVVGSPIYASLAAPEGLRGQR
jgi:hypothetical protein